MAKRRSIIVCTAFALLAVSCAGSSTTVAVPSTEFAEPTAVSATPTPEIPTPVPTEAPTTAPPPTETPASESTAQAQTGSTTIDSDGLPTWEQMIGENIYTHVDDLIGAGPYDPMNDGLRLERLTTVAQGNLIDGEYASEHPPGAFTWRTLSETDGASEPYMYFASDGVAEPGDHGCFELLRVDSQVYTRATADADAVEASADFQLNPEVAAQLEEDEQGTPADVLIDIASDFDMLGVVPTITPLGDGFERRFAVLDAATAQLAADTIAPVSGNSGYQVGMLEIIVDAQGHARSVTLWASLVGDERELSQGSDGVAIVKRSITLYSHAVFGPFVPDLVRTPTMSLVESGYCQPRTTGIVGEWPWRTLIVEGTEVGGGPQMQGAFIAIESDGSFAGSTGCRTFQGTSDIGFASLDNVTVEFFGEPCVDAELPERIYEEALVAVLSQDMRAEISLDRRLFLVGTVDDVPIIAHFRQES